MSSEQPSFESLCEERIHQIFAEIQANSNIKRHSDLVYYIENDGSIDVNTFAVGEFSNGLLILTEKMFLESVPLTFPTKYSKWKKMFHKTRLSTGYNLYVVGRQTISAFDKKCFGNPDIIGKYQNKQKTHNFYN